MSLPFKLTVQILADAKKLTVPFLRSLELHDLPNNQGVGIPYRDIHGKLILTKRRTALRAKDGSYWPAGQPLCAYGQWRIVEAIEHNFLVLVEGESDCWTLWNHKIPALGLPGAGAARTLTAELLEHIKSVYVHVEPDQGGELFRDGVLRRLAELPGQRDVYTFTTPNCKDPSELHCDAPNDFRTLLLEALHQAKLQSRAADAGQASDTRPLTRHGSPADKPCPEPESISLALVTPENVRWLWPGRIPLGKLTILDGDPGLGKSSITLDLAARLTKGEAMPGCEADTAQPAANVVLLTAEDGLGDTIRPRLEVAGADLNKVIAFKGVSLGEGSALIHIVLPECIGPFQRLIEITEAKLVVIDPLVAYLSDNCNAYNDQNVRQALLPLAQVAEASGAALLVVRHLNKQTGKSALYRGGGSIGIIGAARSGLMVCKDPEAPQQRLLGVTKSNLCKPAKTLRYELVEAGTSSKVHWLEELDVGIDDVMTDTSDEGAEPLREADAFLQARLGPAPLTAAEIFAEAAELHISEKAIKRAKARLKIESKFIANEDGHGGHWMWILPPAA